MGDRLLCPTMALYGDPDISFCHPDEWQLRTIAGFAQSVAFQSPTIVVVREPMVEGDTAQLHAQRKLFALRTMQDFALLESASVTLDGVPAARVRYSYTTEEGTIEQSQTFVLAPADRDTKVVTSFLTTARKADADAVRPAFAAALASVRFASPMPTPGSHGAGAKG